MISYDFRSFVKNGELVKTSPSKNLFIPKSITSYSIFVSPLSVFNPPPLIAKGYLIMIVIGVVVISLAMAEKYFGISGHIEIAKSIIGFIQTVMPFAFIAALIYLVFTNPLL